MVGRDPASGTIVPLYEPPDNMSPAAMRFLERMHATIETTSFRTNARYLWPGIILSVLTIAAVVLHERWSLLPVALFMSVWLTGWSFGVYMLVSSVIRAWKSARTEGVLGVGQAGFLTLFSIPVRRWRMPWAGYVDLGLWFGCFQPDCRRIGMNVLFHHLLKAPTLAGRALMDRVEGFKMFLTAVDSDRLQTIARPDKTPQLFERFLPYAFALGVEHAWAQQFSQVLAQAATDTGAGGSAVLFSFVVFRRVLWIIFRSNFYIEL